MAIVLNIDPSARVLAAFEQGNFASMIYGMLSREMA
jgi:hypothetical protein